MTAMVQVRVSILLLQAWCTTLGKYLYVNESMTWNDAQSYCREFHTDLAPVVNREEIWKPREISGDLFSFWTGLVRNDGDEWMWSGGGAALAILWGTGEPNGLQMEDAGLMINYWIHDANRDQQNPFFCFDAIVVREEACWEEALGHCRERHSDLASVTSHTEMLLIQKQLEKNLSTEHVWLGLHFFPGGWRWVDKENLTYEAWNEHGRPSCPAARQKCGSFKVTGWRPSASGILGTNNTLVGVSLGESDLGEESVWEAHDCEQKLYFVCY
ncbi:C-type mannose receptor 2-like [Syngnathus acus]|uniref:C-type mannose receptor 2-like n=1 Tax=Syngnathus acus TaxID=161584 RepID=UPI0018863DA0|nr:C-type mannose receptor 2-like [Syngnathus acus]